MKRAAGTSAILLTILVTGCEQPAGKAELKSDPKLRSQILAACADGTHTDTQECSNAKAIENADKLDRSLGPK
jgi:hypothetical protein